MYVSHESPTQTEARLREVIARADWQVHRGLYAFREFPVGIPLPMAELTTALACVRDDQIWSVLLPADSGAELLTLFSFHFAPGLDNSGFVGWLASHLKATLGTGVLVVCGQNQRRGGIFDYWGVPVEIGPAAIEEVRQLRGEAPPL